MNETAFPILVIGGVLVVFGLVIAVIVLAFHFKKQRRQAIATFALKNGLSYTQHDPYNLPGTYDFNLFSMGDGRGAENLMTGQWKDRRIIEADYWYYTESTDSDGSSSRSYSRFQVALFPIGAYLPKVQVVGETFFTRIADHIGLEDINFESEEFNRIFNVKSTDREFAFKLIDARMMQWLLYLGKRFSLETSGSDLLVYCGQSKPEEIPLLLDAADQTIDRIPRLVWEDYQVKGA